MDVRRLLVEVLEGKTRVITFNSGVFGFDKDNTAGVLSALNFARLAFSAQRNAHAVSRLLPLLCSGQMVENAFAICHEWPGGGHLDAEDVLHVPLFETSLRLVSTEYDSPTPDRVPTLLENFGAGNSSAAILITRYPDVVTCLRLHTSTQNLFVLFNPRTSSGHGYLTSLTVSISLPTIARRLCDPFLWRDARFTQGNLERQEKLPEKCTAYVFVPRVTDDWSIGEESLITSSVMLLTLKAELEELTRANGDLKRKKQQLNKSVLDLRAQLEKEKAENLRHQVSKLPAEDTTRYASVDLPAQFSGSAGKRHRDFSNRVDEMDPSIKLAHQLQASFDSENQSLLMQKQELVQTAQRHYQCVVCLDDFPEDDVILIDSCGHEICRDCARGHVCTKIEERRFPVLCPVCTADSKNKNPGTMSSTLVELIGVSEKQWEAWVEMEMAQFSVVINCRKCRHTGFVDRKDLETSSEIQCPFLGCDHVWCKNCQQTIARDGPKHSCDGTSELDHLMKQQGWRYCPNCKTPIQRTSGCNHLFCTAPNCSTHFCYGCGKVMRGYGHTADNLCTC